MGKNVDLLVSEFLLCCDSSVRHFSSKCKGFRFPPVWCTMVYYSEILNDKKNPGNFWGDRLELWPSKHTLQMVNYSKDKNGSVKLTEFRSLLEFNSHR